MSGFRQTISRRQALEETVQWGRAHPVQPTDPSQFDYAAEDVILARAYAGERPTEEQL